MSLEIERKFLVSPSFLTECDPLKKDRIVQCYMSTDPSKTIRLRTKGSQGFITIKSRSTGIVRFEYEYEIPKDEAEEMMSLFGGKTIEKTRYDIIYGGKKWEVDVFEGDNSGLVVAEIELESEDESFELPPWVLREVSADKRFANTSLTTLPFGMWRRETEEKVEE